MSNHRRTRPRRQPKCRLCTDARWGNSQKFSRPTVDDTAEQIAEIEPPLPPAPCPASAVEFNGERQACILMQGHEGYHCDGCSTWADPWGETDVDQFARAVLEMAS